MGKWNKNLKKKSAQIQLKEQMTDGANGMKEKVTDRPNVTYIKHDKLAGQRKMLA